MGTSTIVLARTDAEAANLITSDHDANDKPFLTGERTPEGFYRVKNGLEQAISRGVAYAPYADLVWCETGVPDIGFAREFAQAVHAACPGKLLSYNCSPSFNWKKNLNDTQIASFQEDLSALGYKYQFITLAGIHINWYNTFQFAHAYANGEGMKHYVNMVQEPEFAARDKGYTFVSHQQEVGAGYFDDVTTPEVETSDVMLLRGLASALDFLASPPDAPSEGGFGTTDANQWLWGLRHTVRFDSLLLAYLEGQPGLSALLSQFSITPSTLPLMPDLPADDPRASLPGFPRDGDGYVVDAAHPGFRKTRFEYRHAPVFRMVVSLKDGAVGGSLVLPGGQSGLNNSAHFADQAALWLGNQTLPLRFHVSDVVAGATGREVFTP